MPRFNAEEGKAGRNTYGSSLGHGSNTLADAGELPDQGRGS